NVCYAIYFNIIIIEGLINRYVCDLLLNDLIIRRYASARLAAYPGRRQCNVLLCMLSSSGKSFQLINSQFRGQTSFLSASGNVCRLLRTITVHIIQPSSYSMS
uniref:Uncharacterized protein n=1 Tax=Glossina palpalis gambiensis TaxID=67801 RepID=A0A1B0AQH8_9MUSC